MEYNYFTVLTGSIYERNTRILKKQILSGAIFDCVLLQSARLDFQDGYHNRCYRYGE